MFDNNSLLNEEGTNNALLHALIANATTIGTSHGLNALGNVSVLAGSKSRHALENERTEVNYKATLDLASAITAAGARSRLGLVLDVELSTRGLHT